MAEEKERKARMVRPTTIQLKSDLAINGRAGVFVTAFNLTRMTDAPEEVIREIANGLCGEQQVDQMVPDHDDRVVWLFLDEALAVMQAAASIEGGIRAGQIDPA